MTRLRTKGTFSSRGNDDDWHAVLLAPPVKLLEPGIQLDVCVRDARSIRATLERDETRSSTHFPARSACTPRTAPARCRACNGKNPESCFRRTARGGSLLFCGSEEMRLEDDGKAGQRRPSIVLPFGLAEAFEGGKLIQSRHSVLLCRLENSPRLSVMTEQGS
jgi:hypothetical protein